MYTAKQPFANIPETLAHQALDRGKLNNKGFSDLPTSGGNRKS
jgi:hypothetical protein